MDSVFDSDFLKIIHQVFLFAHKKNPLLAWKGLSFAIYGLLHFFKTFQRGNNEEPYFESHFRVF